MYHKVQTLSSNINWKKKCSFEIWSSLPICWLTAHLRKIKVFVLHVPWTITVNWETEKARRFFDEMTLQNCINNVDKIVMIMSILADHSWIDQMFPTRCTNFNSTRPIIRMDILCYSQSHQKSNFCYTNVKIQENKLVKW